MKSSVWLKSSTEESDLKFDGTKFVERIVDGVKNQISIVDGVKNWCEELDIKSLIVWNRRERVIENVFFNFWLKIFLIKPMVFYFFRTERKKKAKTVFFLKKIKYY